MPSLSLPFQGDQAVDAHAARAPPPPLLRGEGLVYRTMCFKGDDRALLGLWGDEAEETGHSERGGGGERKEEKRRG